MITAREIGATFTKSVVSRLGTVFAVWLLAHGVPDDVVEQFVQALAVISGLLVDIGLVLLFRGKVR